MAEKVAGDDGRAKTRRRNRRECEELSSLSCRIVEAQENERRAIARELHNVLGQSLTVLKLALDKAMHASPEAVGPALQEAEAIVDEVVGRIRDISLELLPSMLDDLGLLPTLLWYNKRHSEQTGIQVNFKHSGLSRNFPLQVSTAAYRIVQEALTNAARHAGVTDISVRAWSDGKTLFLEIKDRGAGFDPATVPAVSYSGLGGMKQRALSLGGKLDIVSAPGSGTTVTAQLPLQSRKEGR